jgi:anaerobic sulfite reductase subunit B
VTAPDVLPAPYRVAARRAETADTVTLTLQPAAQPIPPHRPGQFTMLYAFGIGEVPVSVSGTGSPVLTQTVRDVGAVTGALCSAVPGDVIGVRGPFGTDWGLDRAAGHDLVLVAGGIGLAPLRPVLLAALAERERYGRVMLLAGARTPRDLVFAAEFASWRDQGAQVEVTVDRAGSDWQGPVGVVTTLIDRAGFDAGRAAAFVCGPEIMMRFSAMALLRRGVPAASIRLSLERNMRCGVGHCGHCQLGPLLLCRDGPVVGYRQAEPLLTIKEL